MIHEKNQINFETGELKKVNANFVQLYDDNLDFIILMTKENPTALSVFLWLVKHMDDRNAIVASQQAIADSLGLHKNTVHLAVKYLKDRKVMTVLRSSSTHIFALNVQIVWRDSALAKKYAHFDAKIYITSSEQDEDEPIFNTELVGHAIRKERKKRGRKPKLTPEEEKSFEGLSKKMGESI